MSSAILKIAIPGKIVRRDPANPTWDPARDYETSQVGSRPKSQVGSHQSRLKSLAGSHIHPRWDPALNPRWDPTNPARNHWYYPASIPGGILPEIIGGISCLRSQVGIEIPSIPPVIIYQVQNPTYPAHKGSCQFHQKL